MIDALQAILRPSHDRTARAEEGGMNDCPLCAASSGEHDMTRTCCRARFLLALPSS